MKFILFMQILLVSIAFGGWNSVQVFGVTRIDLEYFHNSGYDIESFLGTSARLYLNDSQQTILLNNGYRLEVEQMPVPIVKYPSVSKINAAMRAVVAAHSGIARLEHIGTSVKGRKIYAVVVSDNILKNEAEPEIRITGNIHGDEKSSCMSVLKFLENLTAGYDTVDKNTYLVNNSELWIIPLVNPDGYASNQRYNAKGVDLNRDFSYKNDQRHWQGPESICIRDLTMQDWPRRTNYTHPFATGLSFHSGAECVNCVWNFSASEPIPDLDIVTAQASAYARHPSITSYYKGWNIWIPGASWYPTTGDVNDWSYGEVGTVDYTIEVSCEKSPSDWPGIAKANYLPMLEFCISSTYGVFGKVTNGAGEPLNALIEVKTTSESLMFCRSDVVDGGYSKALIPGTYDIVATVNGLGSLTQNNVRVRAKEMVPVNFVFSTGIANEPVEDLFIRISAAPNPVKTACTFSLPDTGIDGSLKIYDISGRIVYEKNISSGVTAYAFSAGSILPSGVYQVRYISRGLSASTRLVVVD